MLMRVFISVDGPYAPVPIPGSAGDVAVSRLIWRAAANRPSQAEPCQVESRPHAGPKHVWVAGLGGSAKATSVWRPGFA